MTRRSDGRPDDVVIPGWAAHPDRLPDGPSPYDDEFDGPLNAHWTNIDTGATFTYDTDKTVPSALYLNTTGMAAAHTIGFYKPCPAFPFTATAKVSNVAYTQAASNLDDACLMVGTATPGKYFICQLDMPASQVVYGATSLWTTPTAFGSNPSVEPAASGYALMREAYLRIVCRSTSDIDALISSDGYVYRKMLSAYDPAMTIASVGLVAHSDVNSKPLELAFDWIRFRHHAINTTT